MRTALYARVSTERQERQQTIDSQLAALRAWAAAQGRPVSDEHVFRDEGYSGSRLDRPGLDALRDAVRDGAVGTLVVLTPDRLARKYAYQVLLLREICGLAMYGITRRASARKPVRQVYECHGKDCILSARVAACPSRTVAAEEIEPVVWDHVMALLADPDQLLAQFDRFAAAADAGSAREQAAEQQLRTRLDRTARADKRLLDAYQAGAISLSELSERRQHLAQERQALEQQQEEQMRLRQQRLQAEAGRANVAAFCERIRSRLAEATLTEKQAILQLVIERIIVGEGRLEIRHVIPLRSPPPGGNDPMSPKATRLRTDGVRFAQWFGEAVVECRYGEPRAVPVKVACLENIAATWSLDGTLTLSLAFDEFWSGPFGRCSFALLLHELAHHEAFHHGRSFPREVEAYAGAAAEVMLARGDEARRMFPRLLASRPDEETAAVAEPVPDSPHHGEMDMAQRSRPSWVRRLREMVQGGRHGGDQQGCPP